MFLLRPFHLLFHRHISINGTALSSSLLRKVQHSVAVSFFILSFPSTCAKVFSNILIVTFPKIPPTLYNFRFVSFYFDVKMQLVMIAAAKWFLYYDVVNEFFL